MKKIILSLFDYSGNWPKYYRDSGLYDVYQVDVKLGLDILDITPGDLPQPIHGILAAPPCTDFASSGAQYWGQKDTNGRTQQSLQLVDKTLEIISYHEPQWWVIENPVGRLAKLRPELGTPWYFQPWWFGDAYTKKTGLWGTFNRDLPQSPVDPDPKSPIMQLGGKSERTKELRSMTPLGFALAFYLANP